MKRLWATVPVTLLMVGCGAEYMPAVAQSYGPRTSWNQVLVLEEKAPEVDHDYEVIGTVIARARKSKNAIAACRKEAAEHGGDAVTAAPWSGKEWRCHALRRRAVPVPEPTPVAAVAAPPEPVVSEPPAPSAAAATSSKKKKRAHSP